MHSGGTSTTGKPFWRRASRRRAAGTKTDGEEGFLLSRIGGMAVLRRWLFEHSAMVIGQHSTDFQHFILAGRHKLSCAKPLRGRGHEP
jgi:hypothetical protein